MHLLSQVLDTRWKLATAWHKLHVWVPLHLWPTIYEAQKAFINLATWVIWCDACRMSDVWISLSWKELQAEEGFYFSGLHKAYGLTIQIEVDIACLYQAKLAHQVYCLKDDCLIDICVECIPRIIALQIAMFGNGYWLKDLRGILTSGSWHSLSLLIFLASQDWALLGDVTAPPSVLLCMLCKYCRVFTHLYVSGIFFPKSEIDPPWQASGGDYQPYIASARTLASAWVYIFTWEYSSAFIFNSSARPWRNDWDLTEDLTEQHKSCQPSFKQHVGTSMRQYCSNSLRDWRKLTIVITFQSLSKLVNARI